ncbi:MAG: hypothetical protein ACOCYG_00895 [Spirochaetota bacterium]
MFPLRVASAAALAILLLASLAGTVAEARNGGDGDRAGADGRDGGAEAPDRNDLRDFDLRVAVTYGFDGVGKPGRWTPVVVRLSNLGDAVHGSIDLRSLQGPRTSTERHPYVIRRDLRIAKGSSEVVRAVLPVGDPALPIEVTVRTESGEVIHEEEVNASLRIAPQALVVSLSDRRVLEGVLMDGTVEEGIRLRASGPVTAAYPLPEFLPEEWIGYHGADVLFIGRAPVERLSERQWQAIVEWLDRGGAAVLAEPVAGAPGEARIAELWERAEPLPPADTGASGIDDALEARSRAAGTLYRLRIDTDLLTGRTGTEPDGTEEAVATEAGVAAREFLRDLALERSRRAPEPALPVLVRRQPFSDSVNQAVLDGPIYTYPSRWLIALATLAYLGAFAAVVRLIRRNVRSTVPALIAMPLLVAGGFYVVLSMVNPPPQDALIEVQRMTGRQGEPVVSLERDLLALAATERRFSLRPPPGTTLLPVEGEPNEVHVANGVRYIRGSLPRWREAHFFLADRVPLPVRVDHQGSHRSGNVTIRNDTNHLLEEVVLIFSDAVYNLGSVSPGQTTLRSYEAAQPVEWDRVAPEHRAVAELRQSALGPLGSAATREAVFLAMGPTLTAPVRAETPFDAEHSFALLELRIPIEAEE